MTSVLPSELTLAVACLPVNPSYTPMFSPFSFELALSFEVGLFECLFLFLVVLCLRVKADCWATWPGSCPVFLEIWYFLGERQVRKLLVGVEALPKGIHYCSFLLVGKVNLLFLGPWVARGVSHGGRGEIVQVDYHLVAEVKHVQGLRVCEALVWSCLHICLLLVGADRGHVHWELPLVLCLWMTFLNSFLGWSTSLFVRYFSIFDAGVESPVDRAVLLWGWCGLVDGSIVAFVPALSTLRIGSLRSICASPCSFKRHLFAIHIPTIHCVILHKGYMSLALLVGVGEAVEGLCSW